MSDPSWPEDGTQPQGDPSRRDDQQAPQQHPYSQQYGYPQQYATAPKHDSATTAMVLGIVSVAGTFFCLVPVLVAPFAWWLGRKSEREIDASHGALTGRGEATAGKILGIIGTVMLVLLIAGLVLLVVLTLTIDDLWDDEYDSGSYDTVVGALRQAVGV